MEIPRSSRFMALMAAIVCVAAVSGGCKESQLESSWLDRVITIDGKAPEWAGREAYFGESEGLKIGFSNDEHYLYVYLSTWNQRTQMQILMNGLTVWFDATGGKGETFGVNYPMRRSGPGMRESMRGARESTPGSHETSRDASAETPRDMQQMLGNLLRESRGELAIVGSGGEPIASLTVTDSGSTDVEAMIDIANRTLIYELKLPLERTDGTPYAINAEPGKTIGIGFKVGTRELGEMRRGEGTPSEGGGERPGGGEGGFPGGGGGGGGGFHGGGGGGGMGGRGEGPGGAQPFELWTKVRLAAGPSASPKK
ncbi:MAG TPA: hypothetical protein VII85_09960 [Candidatus Krumholzibacteriaceae bacterium]